MASGAPVGSGTGRRLPYFLAQSSSRPRTAGISAKLCTGGGDGTDHSRVRPSHGSAGAVTPRRRLWKALRRKTSIERARRNAPTVEVRFQSSQLRFGAYV